MAVGEVADEAGEDPFARDRRLADRQFDRKRLAAFTHRAFETDVADHVALAGLAVFAQVRIVVACFHLRHQHCDVLADHLARGIAEDEFGGGAERGDDAVLIHYDHRVGDGVEDRPEMVFAADDRRFGRLLVRDVADDLAEPAQCPRIVSERSDRNVREEFGAVLADSPAFLLDPAIAVRAGEVRCGLARGDIVGGVEDREIAADDLRLGPALDPLGTAVPDRHAAAAIEHVDRIGGRAVDQQPEFLRQHRIAARHRLGVGIVRRLRRDHAGGAVARGAQRQIIETRALFDTLIGSVGGQVFDARVRNMTHVKPRIRYMLIVLR